MSRPPSQRIPEAIVDRTAPSRSSASNSAGRWPAVALAAALAVATLAGCASTPSSYLYDNQVYYRAVRDRYPLSILAIDGSSPAFKPAPIAPGEHTLRLDATAVGGFSERVAKTYPITIEPCTRYYLAAQRQSQLSQDWELVIERTFPVGGCDADTERAKARTTAISGLPSPATSVVQSIAARDEQPPR